MTTNAHSPETSAPETQPDETRETQPRRARGGWRFTRRSASIFVALLMIAAPAGASVIVQNYMAADITAAPPCFVKTAGADPTNSTQATFSADDTTDLIQIDGVDLLQEKITVTGMTGDRVVYTDMVRYENNCLEPITVQLNVTDLTGTWDDLAAEIWISNIETPANIDPNLDPIANDEWNDDAIVIPAGSAAPFVESTGTVVVQPNASIQGAFVVSADVAFSAGTASVTWIASATI